MGYFRRVFIPLSLALSLLFTLASCGAEVVLNDTGRSASTVYYFAATSPSLNPILATYDVVDTGNTSGDFKIFRRIDPIDDVSSTVYISGTGPLGSGDYIMRIIDPIEDPDYYDDYFYVSGL